MRRKHPSPDVGLLIEPDADLVYGFTARYGESDDDEHDAAHDAGHDLALDAVRDAMHDDSADVPAITVHSEVALDRTPRADLRPRLGDNLRVAEQPEPRHDPPAFRLPIDLPPIIEPAPAPRPIEPAPAPRPVEPLPAAQPVLTQPVPAPAAAEPSPALPPVPAPPPQRVYAFTPGPGRPTSYDAAPPVVAPALPSEPMALPSEPIALPSAPIALPSAPIAPTQLLREGPAHAAESSQGYQAMSPYAPAPGYRPTSPFAPAAPYRPTGPYRAAASSRTAMHPYLESDYVPTYSPMQLPQRRRSGNVVTANLFALFTVLLAAGYVALAVKLGYALVGIAPILFCILAVGRQERLASVSVVASLVCILAAVGVYTGHLPMDENSGRVQQAAIANTVEGPPHAGLKCPAHAVTSTGAPFCYQRPAHFRDVTTVATFTQNVPYRTMIQYDTGAGLAPNDVITVVADQVPYNYDDMTGAQALNAVNNLRPKLGVAGVVSVGPVRPQAFHGARAYEFSVGYKTGIAETRYVIVDGDAQVTVGCASYVHPNEIAAGCQAVLATLKVESF